MGQIIGSREAQVLIKKHSWNVYGRVAYGFLGGIEQTIYCAVPISSVAGQLQLDRLDKDSRIVDVVTNAMRSMGIDLIGRYVSSGMGTESMSLVYNRQYRLFIDFYMMCCPNCSYAREFLNGEPVAVVDKDARHRVRLTNDFNQRRLLKKVNDALGRASYLDPITTIDTSVWSIDPSTERDIRD